MSKINDSREAILAKIKTSKPAARPRCDIPTFHIAGDALRNFVGHVKGFDGECQMFTTRDEAVDWLNRTVSTKPGQVFSTVGGVSGNVTLIDFETPADMHTIDVCIAEARMGVGETGSLLVDECCLGKPAAALFSTDLYLLIDRTKIVDGLQDAYAMYDMSKHQYSAFFSGPSATADIEAVHITGAQGEISLTAVIYNCASTELRVSNEDLGVIATPLAPAIKLKRETNPQIGQDSV